MLAVGTATGDPARFERHFCSAWIIIAPDPAQEKAGNAVLYAQLDTATTRTSGPSAFAAIAVVGRGYLPEGAYMYSTPQHHFAVSWPQYDPGVQ